MSAEPDVKRCSPRAKVVVLWLVLLTAFAVVHAEKTSTDIYRNRIDYCNPDASACTTSDSMQTISGGDTVLLDTGGTGFCGKAGVEEEWFVPAGADTMTFDLEAQGDAWAGEAQILINGGGGWNEVFSREGNGNGFSASGDHMTDVSSYSGSSIQIRYEVRDYSHEYCDMSDHSISFEITPSLSESNQPPAAPVDPQPVNGAKVRDSSTTISAEYNDPDGDSGTLTFYNADGTEINSCSVDDGGRCGVSWNSYSHGSNEWYAVAEDSAGASTTGSNWELVYNHPPSVDSLDSPPDGSTVYGESVQLEATVSDPDGDTLTVTFSDENGDVIKTDTVIGDTAGTTASVEWDVDRGKTYEWDVSVSDGWDSEQSGTSRSFYVNSLPGIQDIKPDDGSLTPGDPVELQVVATDPEGNPVTVYFFDASDDTLIGKEAAGADDAASVDWHGLEQGGTYNWEVKASDGNENLTPHEWSFKRSLAENFRPQVRIRYQYTHVIANPDNPSYFFFTVENRVEDSKTLNTTLSGVSAEFVGDGWREYTLEGNSEKRFQVRVAPETTGSDLELRLKTENQELGLSQTETVPVYSRETPVTSTAPGVPGIGLLQLLVISLLSTVLASASL